jgi:hypothetical protein
MTRILTTSLLVSLAFLAAGVQSALANGDCNNPAICQYVESTPTSTGSKAVGKGGDKQVSKLPGSVRSSLGGAGADLATLERLATNASAGAPKQVKVGKAEQKRVNRALKAKAVNQPAPLRAGFDAVSGDGRGRSLVLFIVVGLMTLAAVALAVARRRSASRR